MITDVTIVQLVTFGYVMGRLSSPTSIEEIKSKANKISFGMRYIQYNDYLRKDYDLCTSDAHKTSIITSKFNILHFKDSHYVFQIFGFKK